MFNSGSSRFALVAGLLVVAAASRSQVIWNESVNGDLSGDRFNPTSLNLSFGSNGIVGTMMPGDREYVHLHLSPGMALGQIIVVDYDSGDPIAFIGVQAGTIFTEPHDNPEVSNLLGYTLWGTDHIGTNILPTMGSAFGTIGFTPPLTGSDYTFWIQQTGDVADYHLNFVATPVPEPATMSLAVGLAALLLRRRRA